jgi:hypothetical protein
VPFNLDETLDCCIPKVCPVLGLYLAVGTGTVTANSPTLDRIDPSKGYVSGNVHVISHKANSIKSNATPAEIIRVGRYFKALMKELNETKETTC